MPRCRRDRPPAACRCPSAAADARRARLDPVHADQGQPAVGLLQARQALGAPVARISLFVGRAVRRAPRGRALGVSSSVAAGGQQRQHQGGQDEFAHGLQRPRRKSRSSSALRQLHPGRPAVVALAGALGRFHVAQQGVHFGQGQPAIGAHRGVAGHGGQQFVARLLDARGCCRVRAGRSARRSTSASGSTSASSAGTLRTLSDCGPVRRSSKPSAASVSASRSAMSASRSATASDSGTSSGCDADAVAVLRGLQSFVGDALVRGVHVDQDQAVGRSRPGCRCRAVAPARKPSGGAAGVVGCRHRRRRSRESAADDWRAAIQRGVSRRSRRAPASPCADCGAAARRRSAASAPLAAASAVSARRAPARVSGQRLVQGAVDEIVHQPRRRGNAPRAWPDARSRRPGADRARGTARRPDAGHGTARPNRPGAPRARRCDRAPRGR